MTSILTLQIPIRVGSCGTFSENNISVGKIISPHKSGSTEKNKVHLVRDKTSKKKCKRNLFGQDCSEHDIISIFQSLNESSKLDNQGDETYRNQDEVWRHKFAKLNRKYCEVQRQREILEVENKSLTTKLKQKNELKAVGNPFINNWETGTLDR